MFSAASISHTAWLAAAPNIASGRSSGVTRVKLTPSMPIPHTWRAVISAIS